MKAASFALTAALALVGCGGGGGGGKKAPPSDIHQGEVLLEFTNYCHDSIVQLWYCPCPSSFEYPLPIDAWIKIDLPFKGETGGGEPMYALGTHEKLLFDWIPIGYYAFLWRTSEDWSNRFESIPSNLPELPFEWYTWNGRECREIYAVISSDGMSDVKDLSSIGLTCPGYK